MKKYFFFFLFLILTFSAVGQNMNDSQLNLQNIDIVGRWIEIERTTSSDSRNNDDTKSSIYIFKNDSAYHKGTEIDNMIIFPIAGRFVVKNDSIQIAYYDFSDNRGGNQRLRKMSMKILSYSTNEMKVLVRESRYNKYEAVLKRQNLND